MAIEIKPTRKQLRKSWKIKHWRTFRGLVSYAYQM